MNPSEYGSLAGACSLDTQGSHGPDRIARTTYDAAGQATKVETGYAVSGEAADEVTTAYTGNGQISTVTDANGNRTTYEYDGHDRLVKTRMPSPTTAGTSSTTDYEQLTRDASGNVTSRRLRDGNSIAITYDALNRLTAIDPPGSELTITYSYDLVSRMTGASQTGNALTFGYDALDRNLSQAGPRGTVSYTYDLAGRRTRMTYADSGLYIDYDYLATGEISAIRENGATSGAGLLGTYAYDDRGRRTSLTRGNGTVTSYAYDNVSRLTSLAQDLTTSGADVTFAMTYNPASQIATRSGAHGGYAWQGHYAVNRNYTANGLNQYTAAGGVTPTYDTRGNLTSAGSITYGYDSANMLVSATGSVQLGYDPLRRLAWTTGNPNFTHFAYDNEALIAEYDYSGNLVRRYVHGPGVDEPLVWYEGTGTSDRRWLHADERGSIVAASNASGAPIGYNSYDEYGIPASGNIGRFQYTGQQWIAELGMYHYRARIYSPTLGRFLQTDPIGFAGGMNLHAYVGGDPVNSVDPSGTVDIFMTGTRIARLDVGAGLCGSCSGFSAHVGMRNMAAERRRNDSVSWTATGDVTTYSDGSQRFSGSVTFGGRLAGTTPGTTPAIRHPARPNRSATGSSEAPFSICVSPRAAAPAIADSSHNPISRVSFGSARMPLMPRRERREPGAETDREVPMKLWYKFLLLALALTVIPVALLGYGFSGGRFVFPVVSEFSPVHLAEFILSGIWALSPLLLAPFGIRWRKKQPQ